MGLLEEQTHVFIVRFWSEPREAAGQPAEWRGVVEHLPGGERRFVTEPGGIAAFIRAFLEQAEPGPGSRGWSDSQQSPECPDVDLGRLAGDGLCRST